MKKRIALFLVIIITMMLSIGLLTATTGATEQAPAVQEEPQQQEQQVTFWDTKINLDGSAVTTFLLYIPQQQLETPTFIEMVSKQIEKSGYTAEIADKDGQKMLLLKKEVKKGEDLTFSMPELNVNFNFLTVKNLFSTMYVVTTGVDLSGAPANQEFMKLNMTLPVTPKFINSESKTGLVHNWSIKGGSANPINVVMMVPNIVNILVALLIIALIVFIIFMVLFTNKRKEKQNEENYEEYTEEDDTEESTDPENEDNQEEIEEDQAEEIGDTEETDDETKEDADKKEI